jgi:hypothetical protein
MKHLIGYAHNNVPMFVDLIRSDAAQRIAHQPNLLSLATEALQFLTLHGDKLELEQDMGRIIGYDSVIETNAGDAVFYARLVRDTSYTKFVKTNKPLSTQYLTLLLSNGEDDSSYELDDVWIGRFRPPHPGSVKENTKSNAYWEHHAVIFDNQALQSNTLTKVCPY